MTDPLLHASAARLPAEGLAGLAPFRARGDMRAIRSGGHLWVFFTEGDIEVARTLLALPRAELFRHEGQWRRLGHSLPVFEVPDPNTGRELSRLVFPLPASPREATNDWHPVEASLVRGGIAQPLAALRLSLRELENWATMATRFDLTGFLCATDGVSALLVGGRLPPLAGETFWGEGLLVLSGFRPEPPLPLRVLREAFGIGPGEIGLWTPTGLETLPTDALQGATLARLRLALEAV